jgi:hypothetical protein
MFSWYVPWETIMLSPDCAELMANWMVKNGLTFESPLLVLLPLVETKNFVWLKADKQNKKLIIVRDIFIWKYVESIFLECKDTLISIIYVGKSIKIKN